MTCKAFDLRAEDVGKPLDLLWAALKIYNAPSSGIQDLQFLGVRDKLAAAAVPLPAVHLNRQHDVGHGKINVELSHSKLCDECGAVVAENPGDSGFILADYGNALLCRRSATQIRARALHAANRVVRFCGESLSRAFWLSGIPLVHVRRVIMWLAANAKIGHGLIHLGSVNSEVRRNVFDGLAAINQLAQSCFRVGTRGAANAAGRVVRKVGLDVRHA
jgi:hypothetical protein